MSLVVTDFLFLCGWPIVGTNFSEWVQIFKKNSLRGEPVLGGSKLNVTDQTFDEHSSLQHFKQPFEYSNGRSNNFYLGLPDLNVLTTIVSTANGQPLINHTLP